MFSLVLPSVPEIKAWLRPASDFAPPMPPLAPLAMPRQSLTAAPRLRRRPAIAGALWPRLIAFGGTAAVSLFTAGLLAWALSSGGLTALEGTFLGLFLALFAWTAFSAITAVAGFVLVLGRRSRPQAAANGPWKPLTTRTAILAPIYNEDIGAVLARIQAMHEDLTDQGVGRRFAFFLLSDTTGLEQADEERRAWIALRRRLSPDTPLYYRRRPANVDRKAGNIADWVEAHGGAYDHMVILDADSLLEAETIVRLVRSMEAEPDTGLIQTSASTINAASLLARTQQFASRLYGPIFSAGLAWWSGPEGNYWGHNAIIRVRAFAQCAGLPWLRGPRPFGGHILSHDFVEAALLRRGGWTVRFEPFLGGSYEESPPSLVDLIIRDRRWCQGNLQHLPIIGARGLHWISRLHLLRGASAYLTAPLWLLFLVVGMLQSREAALGPRGGAMEHTASVLTAAVFIGSLALLLLPKLLAWAAAALDPPLRRGYGGLRRLCGGVVVEIFLSTLVAAVLMQAQTMAVIDVLRGRDVGWTPQRRHRDAISLGEALRFHGGQMALGLALAVGALSISPSLIAWMAPVIVGLVGAAPLSVLTARPRRSRLLLTPEDTAPPWVVRRARRLMTAPLAAV